MVGGEPAPRNGHSTSHVAALTPREREIASLVAAGSANKEIADRLGVSQRTVKAHLTSIFAQIGVTDRTSAALWAHRQGLVSGPPVAAR